MGRGDASVCRVRCRAGAVRGSSDHACLFNDRAVTCTRGFPVPTPNSCTTHAPALGQGELGEWADLVKRTLNETGAALEEAGVAVSGQPDGVRCMCARE